MINETKFVSPFKKLCVTVGNLPTAYIESMSYYEGLTFLVKFLADDVVPVVNNNSEVVKELQDYVENYFNNLDVQEEIDTKLDQMASEGELTEIILDYLEMSGLLMFDTKADLKLAENLIDGSFCKTLGDLSYDDGEGVYYKVRLLEEGDVIDEDNLVALTNYPTLVAEKIIDKYVKDLQEDLGNISELTTTDKTDVVSAVNEVNSKASEIGDLDSLTTTDKTDVVSALNEVNGKAGDLYDTFNIKNFHNARRIQTDSDTAEITLGKINLETYTFTQTSSGMSYVLCNINCATNDEGSIGKIYGTWYCNANYTINNTNGFPCLRFRCSDFNVIVPEETYNIDGAGVNFCDGASHKIAPCNIVISSDGYIYLTGRISGEISSTAWDSVYTASIYFFKDFGDTTPEDEAV